MAIDLKDLRQGILGLRPRFWGRQEDRREDQEQWGGGGQECLTFYQWFQVRTVRMRTGIPHLLPLVPGENSEDEDRNTSPSTTGSRWEQGGWGQEYLTFYHWFQVRTVRMRTGIPQLLPLVPGENREDEDRNPSPSTTGSRWEQGGWGQESLTFYRWFQVRTGRMRTGIPYLLPLVPGENSEDEDRNPSPSTASSRWEQWGWEQESLNFYHWFQVRTGKMRTGIHAFLPLPLHYRASILTTARKRSKCPYHTW